MAYLLAHTINVSTLEKYRDEAYAEPRNANGMKWHEFDLFEHNLFDGAIKDEKKRQHIKSCLNKLELAAQENPEHIGNILYLAEPYTFISGAMSPQDIYFMKHVHDNLMNLYKLLKLAENDTLGGPGHYHDINDRYETLPFTAFADLRQLIIDFFAQ